MVRAAALSVLACALIAGCDERPNGHFVIANTPQGAVLLDSQTGRTWLLKPNDLGHAAWYALSRSGPLD